ncbi:MAG: TetM/TetW/TetO/TetS family tetracycline resistance ribosomal protection protein [Clostridia bacterium]|nr:TetM/TetW/TetO/TetS family tetracycline resistance ribosomal protection protein [Clostridia bacterium]
MGIIAHVDAGKTTLSEAILYKSGAIKELGRVDKRDAHLDTYSLERERGITIFSKQTVFDYKDTHVSLIDTPGHVDFSCETERSLSVQDYCVLVISATDGIKPHTRTLWQLLAARKIPTFIFINKTDICDRTREELFSEVRTVLSDKCVNFSHPDTYEFFDEVAGKDASLIEEFLETDMLTDESIAAAIRKRLVFPCFFGSALKLKGVDELLEGIDRFSRETPYPVSLFGAKVYKIQRDQNGRRMTLAKITGGTLLPKTTIEFRNRSGEQISEKVEEIRLITHDKSKPLKEAVRGTLCAIIGPTETAAGTGIGIEANDSSMLSPVLDYRMILPREVSPYDAYLKLTALAEEDPSLGINWVAGAKEIRISLMGEIQLEVLKRLIKERLGIAVEFDEGSILYRETVDTEVIGSGHFEPLRHYAEAHVRIEPLPEGSGVISASDCSTDDLSSNWQRLVLTHIDERVHRGVLIGAPLTDVKITLIGGKAHLKHTEGGDFRQATYRAIRQGLMKARSVILEPTFDFRIEVPTDYLGRVMTDITNMHGTAKAPEIHESISILEGNCPVATMRSYAGELRAFTRGEGKITMNVGGYAPAHNQDEIIANSGYDPLLDERNPASSVFCKAGAGYAVPWDEADAMMHVKIDGTEEPIDEVSEVPVRARAIKYSGTVEEDKELMRIFEATYGKIKPRKAAERKENKAPDTPRKRSKPYKNLEEYVILDGYNVIFAWEELARTAEVDLALARDMLTRIMCSYTAFRKCHATIVFDAYKRKGGEGSEEECGNVKVIYTKEAETADAYIEKASKALVDSYTVRVVTSDLEEQYVVLGHGALRVSAKEFRHEIENTTSEINETIDRMKYKSKS